jgi:hypothetical protein
MGYGTLRPTPKVKSGQHHPTRGPNNWLRTRLRADLRIHTSNWGGGG